MTKYLTAFLLLLSFNAFSQQEELKEKGFKKENLFTGGSISLSFFNNTFLIGANPVLGYRLGRFADAGLVVNFQNISVRDYRGVFNDKLRQTIYGAGTFVRFFPVNFLFGQIQAEYNFISEKYISPVYGTEKNTVSGKSILVGGGYATGRDAYGNSGFFYMSLLWEIFVDESGAYNSPYTDAYRRPFPVIRAGFNIPLFQGRGSRF